MTLGVAILVIPYGFLANRYGRREILFLALVGLLFSETWGLLICKLHASCNPGNTVTFITINFLHRLASKSLSSPPALDSVGLGTYRRWGLCCDIDVIPHRSRCNFGRVKVYQYCHCLLSGPS